MIVAYAKNTAWRWIFDDGKKAQIFFLVLLFFSFIALRVFVDYTHYYIGTDEPNYLNLAKNFPHHTNYNQQLYLIHPPLHSYALYFLSHFFEDHRAGITLSLLSSIASFILIYKILSLFVKDWRIIAGVLLLYTLSPDQILMSKIVYKESFMTLLFLSSIYFFIKGLKGRKGNLAIATLLSSATALTTDYFIFLVPTLACAIIFFWERKSVKLRYPVITILFSCLFYLLWIYTRFYVYTHNDYFPGGDGYSTQVSHFGVKQLLNPAFFPDEAKQIGLGPSDLKHYIFVSGLMLNFLPLVIPAMSLSAFQSLLHNKLFLFNIAFHTLLALLLLFGILHVLRSVRFASLPKTLKNNHNLFLLLAMLFFLFPLTSQFSIPRRLLLAMIIMNYFIVLGLFLSLKNQGGTIIKGAILILALSTPFFIATHPFLSFNTEKIVEAQDAAAFLNALPKDGILSQTGYTPEFSYLTDKRVLSLPLSPEKLEDLIERYDMNYVVFGEHYWNAPSQGDSASVMNYDTIMHIESHPERFKPLATITEDLTSFENLYITIGRKDSIHVYEIIR